MPDSATPVTLDGSRILVVDDEAYVRDLVCRWLKSTGYVCGQAGNVQAALDYVEANDIHLIVSDINMPDRNGLELLDEVHRNHPNIAVLMMTGVGEAKTAIAALTNGAWGYLVKPVERQELVCQVNGALERRQLRLEQRDYTRNLEDKVRQQTAEIRRAHEETIYRLVTASLCRDEETGMHIKRTGLLSEALALAVGWSPAEAEVLRFAAPMHDVGKIGVPDAILQKPGKLTPAEFEIMKTHTIIGAKMLEGSHSTILTMACEIALNHHEHWDGKGYPRGLAAESIPESARIVSIVDVFDALSHDRVYRPAMPEDIVLQYMRQGAGTQFDPALLAMFLANYDTLREISQSNPDEIKLSPFAMALIPEMSSSGNAENILAAVDPVR
jgi:putative two-component system response regulator